MNLDIFNMFVSSFQGSKVDGSTNFRGSKFANFMNLCEPFDINFSILLIVYVLN